MPNPPRRFFRNLDHLTRVAFPPMGGGSDNSAKLDEMAGQVIGTFPVLPAFRDIASLLVSQVSANGQAQTGVAVPNDVVRFVMAASLVHDDPVARVSSIGVAPATGTAYVTVVQNAALSTNVPLALPRVLTLAAGQRLLFEVAAIAAGQHMTISFLHFDVPEGMVGASLSNG